MQVRDDLKNIVEYVTLLQVSRKINLQFKMKKKKNLNLHLITSYENSKYFQ